MRRTIAGQGTRSAYDAGLPRGRLDLTNPVVTAVERLRELLVHRTRLVAADSVHVVSVGAEQPVHIPLGGTPEHRGSADLVAVELEDREHGAVATRIEEAHAFPGALEGSGLRLAVTDDARCDQVGVVKNSAEGVDERVPQLTAFVDGAGRGNAHVTGDAAGC